MGFNFNFLRDATKEKQVAGKVFGFLANPLNTAAIPANITRSVVKKATGKTLPDPMKFIKETGEQIARVPETVARSYVQHQVGPAYKKFGKDLDLSSGEVTDPIRKTLYGSKPVETYQKRTAGNKRVLEESGNPTLSKFADPISLLGLGLTVGSDVTGFGAGKGELVERLAKETTEQGVRKLLKKGGTEYTDDVVQALTKTKDRNIVENILAGKNKIANPPPQVIPPPQDIVDVTVPKTPKPKVVKPSKEQELYVRDYAETLKGMESGTTGGQLVKDAEGGYKRVTEHSPFYRKTFEETGRKPTNADWLEESRRQLESGTAGFGAADEYGKIPTNGKQRKFLKTVAESDTTDEGLKQGVKSITPQTYEQRGNRGLLEEAKSQVGDDTEGALVYLKDVERVSDEDVAVGQVVMQRLQQAGRHDDAAQLVDVLDNKLRESGRAVQAASLWGRLSPEGILKLAARKIRRAREATEGGVFKKGFEDEAGTVRAIKETVEGVAPKPKDVQRAVREAAEDLTTGQKVAKKVETAVSPRVKKKADTLVAEITKKIKQEMLAPLPKESKKTSTQILKEVFERNKEAQEAFPEAQSILREKFADNPEALKALDKFFESDLGIPAASKTVDSAIREQMIKNESTISNIIHKSWAGQKQSVEDIAKALTQEGFDEESAKVIAKEVTGRLDTQLSAAKKKALESMASEAPRAAKKTFADKVTKLSNLGALDDADYLDLARGKLKLPQLTPEVSEKLSTLAQKMQGLADDDPQKYRILQDIGETMADAVPPSMKERIWEVFGAPRSLLASSDISAMGRQGLALGTRFPKEYKEAFKTQIKYFGNEEGFKEGMARIAADSDFKLINDDMKVALTGVVHKPEEMFSSTILESDMAKKLGVGHLIGASDRGYTGALTEFRNSVAKNILTDLRAAGIDPSTLPKSHLESLGWYINTFSGRGGKPGKWLEKNGELLSKGLFSPQLWASRLRILDPTMAFKLKGPARKLYLQNMGSLAGVMGTVLTLATLAGADVETDARSSDFLKIKVGDTRYDILGGLQQNIVAAHRIVSGEKKSSQTGKVTALRGENKPYRGDNPFTVLFDLIENKESPIVATGSRVLRGEDRGGQPINKGKEALGLIAPLAPRETVEQGAREGLPGVLKSIPGYLGVGTQTYGLQDLPLAKEQKETVDKAISPVQKEAYTRFYQYQKTGPDRDSASRNIKKALEPYVKSGDQASLQKAVEIAKKYNEDYLSSFKDWGKKYPQYKQDETLLKDLNSKLITDGSFSRWVAGLKE